MAKPIELGLVLEGEDAERFFEYDENTKVSEELIAMFIEGKEIYEQKRNQLVSMKNMDSKSRRKIRKQISLQCISTCSQ